MDEFLTACPCNCYSTCLFRVQIENNAIKRISSDSANLATPYGPCIKGLSYIERTRSSRRIIHPLKKTSSGKFEQIGQKEALNIISENLLKIKNEWGSTSLLWYRGSGEDVKYLGKDIRFIKKSTGRLKQSTNIIISNRSFLSAYGFALILFLAVLFIRREHIRRNADISLVRNRRAAKIAGKRLQEASRCLKSGEIDKFHEEILKALWGYISDKLNIPVSELTRINALESLKQNEVGEELINSLSIILDKCEFARFAPTSSDTEASEIYEEALNFIRSVENIIS